MENKYLKFLFLVLLADLSITTCMHRKLNWWLKLKPTNLVIEINLKGIPHQNKFYR